MVFPSACRSLRLRRSNQSIPTVCQNSWSSECLPILLPARERARVALRYFNAAGADPDGEIGEDHNPETHAGAAGRDAAAGRRPSITVFGEDYPNPDGTCIRDFRIHVVDLAGCVKALERLEVGNARPAYNLGTGKGISVRGLIDAAERVTGRKIPTVIGERRAGDPPELVADPNSQTMISAGRRPGSVESILRERLGPGTDIISARQGSLHEWIAYATLAQLLRDVLYLTFVARTRPPLTRRRSGNCRVSEFYHFRISSLTGSKWASLP